MVSARESRSERDPGGGHVAEHPPRVHARVRRRRLAGQHRHTRGPAAVHPSRHPADRRAGVRSATASACTTARKLGRAAFVLVNTGAESSTTRAPPKTTRNRCPFNYDGDGGIPIGGLLQRALFAWRFRDVNLLISDLIQRDSRIMIFRNITERVQKAAPFLQFDADPYAAIVDGRLVWIWDAYTTTNEYPYSQPVVLEDVARAEDGTFPARRVGELHPELGQGRCRRLRRHDDLLRHRSSDPIIQVWGNAFPDLFTPMSEATADLLAHFRYPENLFQVQADQFTSYHVTDPDVFYQKRTSGRSRRSDRSLGRSDGRRTLPADAPYYVLMRLPGETEETFSLILPFTPLDRQNMVAWMAAKSDPGGLRPDRQLRVPVRHNVDGPTQSSRGSTRTRFAASARCWAGRVERRFGDFL